jgi:hypothetical protein
MGFIHTVENPRKRVPYTFAKIPGGGRGGGVNAVWAKSQGGTPFWPYFIPLTTPHPLCASFINATKLVKDRAHFSAFPWLKQHCQPTKNETKCLKNGTKLVGNPGQCIS